MEPKMSVLLTAIDTANTDSPKSISTSNGEWMAATAACNAFDPDLPKWNGNHDSVKYTPEQLRQMARRIEQMKHLPEDLRWLANLGGAELG
jgi:hypothetical protein